MLGNIIGINDNEIMLKLTVDVSKMSNLVHMLLWKILKDNVLVKLLILEME